MVFPELTHFLCALGQKGQGDGEVVLQEVSLDREDLGYHLWSVLKDDTLVRGMDHLLVQDGTNIGRAGSVSNIPTSYSR